MNWYRCLSFLSVSIAALLLAGVLTGAVFLSATNTAHAQTKPTQTKADLQPVTIAVLAFRGFEEAIARWKPTADYLSAKIPGYIFRILPLTLPEMETEVAKENVDFILTNTGNYVNLESTYGVTRIVTLKPSKNVEAGSLFGAVIVTRADRNDINTLSDLKGKTFMGVKPGGFGGFQMAWRELLKGGIDPFKDFSELRFSGFPQDIVAYEVLDGEVDAGTFRTDTLETMATEGAIKLKDFKVLGQKTYPGFPYLVSTQLYPEWPLAKAHNTPQDLAQKVAISLLGMPAYGPPAIAGRYSGWTVPLDYQSVHDLFRELHIGPYKHLGNVSLQDVIEQHWHWIAFGLVLILLTAFWAARTEHLVAKRTAELSEANADLEREISERHRAEEKARSHQNQLAHVWRVSTMGEMATTLAHELNQPLSAISNFARGCVRRIEIGVDKPHEIIDALRQISTQSERAANIISHIRAFVRKDEPSVADIDANEMVSEITTLMAAEARRHDATLILDLSRDIPLVVADKVQVEQVILNLISNGLEAMNANKDRSRTLTIRVQKTAVGEVEIAVHDTGPGLPPGAADKIFDPFFTTKSEGLGMGLSISRSIVEAQGGRLWLEQDKRTGTTFHFTLPISVKDRTEKTKGSLAHAG